jgi:hypothetical protein
MVLMENNKMNKSQDGAVAPPVINKRRRLRGPKTLDAIINETARLYARADKGEIDVKDASMKANILAIQRANLEARHVARIEAQLDEIRADLIRTSDAPLLTAMKVD